MPRGRRYLKLRAPSPTPFASNADASVSPGWPSYSWPSKVKRSTRPRSICPPAGSRKGWLTDLAQRHLSPTGGVGGGPPPVGAGGWGVVVWPAGIPPARLWASPELTLSGVAAEGNLAPL